MNLDTTVLLALALDAAFGEPAWIYARVPHPVVFFGRLVGLLDRTLNSESAARLTRRFSGIAAVFLLLALTAGPAWLLSWSLSVTSWGWVVEAILASTLIAQQSLYTHVAAVASALETEGLAGGRRAVSMIVGRNPQSLDEHGVCRAAIEFLRRELLRRHRGPRILVRRLRISGPCRLQGDQHRRQHDRPPHAPS